MWKFVGSKAFFASLPKDGPTIRVYEQYLKDNNKEYLSKNNRSFKTIGEQNGKQVIEIDLDSLNDAFSTTDKTAEDDAFESKDESKAKKREKNGSRKKQKRKKKKNDLEEIKEEKEDDLKNDNWVPPDERD